MSTCYLKTQQSKFKKFSLMIEKDQLNFYKFDDTAESNATATPRATHALNNVHITFGAIE